MRSNVNIRVSNSTLQILSLPSVSSFSSFLLLPVQLMYSIVITLYHFPSSIIYMCLSIWLQDIIGQLQNATEQSKKDNGFHIFTAKKLIFNYAKCKMGVHIHCLQNQTWLHTPCLIEHITFFVLISEVVPPCVPTLMKLDATKLSNATMIKELTEEKTLVEGKNFYTLTHCRICWSLFPRYNIIVICPF